MVVDGGMVTLDWAKHQNTKETGLPASSDIRKPIIIVLVPDIHL